MNRKNVIEVAAVTILTGTLLTANIVQVEQKAKLEEILIEKENVISDMETQLFEQSKMLEQVSNQFNDVQTKYNEVLHTLDETNKQINKLKQENEALLSQNKKLANQVSALEKEKQTRQTTVSRDNQPSSVAKEFYVEATAYTAYCKGCSGKTATGLDLRANPDMKVIAVDPRVIPLGSKVWVEGYGYAIAADTGGAIKGYKIDVFIPNKEQVYTWGRKRVLIKVLK